MRLVAILSIWLLIVGAALVAASVATGETDVSLVVVFPVLTGSGLLFLSGIALIVASFLSGFAAIWAASLASHPQEAAGAAGNGPDGYSATNEHKSGGLILIGPIPIAFGSNRKTARLMLIVGVAIAVAMLIMVLLAVL